MKWRIGPNVRCDLIVYSGKNLSGKKGAVQLFPTGAKRGKFNGGECSSMGIRALHGTRIILAASPEDSWELAAWRCIRMLPGNTLRSQRQNGLPGVRIPDLDALDAVNAKRTDDELRSTYADVERLADGEGWTFGRVGTLKNRVRFVWVEREDVDRILTDPEKVARAILEVLKRDHPKAVQPAMHAAVGSLREVLTDPAEAVDDLKEWIK